MIAQAARSSSQSFAASGVPIWLPSTPVSSFSATRVRANPWWTNHKTNKIWSVLTYFSFGWFLDADSSVFVLSSLCSCCRGYRCSGWSWGMQRSSRPGLLLELKTPVLPVRWRLKVRRRLKASRGLKTRRQLSFAKVRSRNGHPLHKWKTKDE